MISLYEYNLPFSKAFKTAASVFTERKGIIIQFKGDAESVAEAAPLPGYSDESFEEVCRFFIQFKPEISKFLSHRFTAEDISDFLFRLPDLKSAQWAVSMLALSILSKRETKSIAEILNLPAPQKSIRINDVIGTGKEDELIERSRRAIENGFEVLKFKISGSPQNLVKVLDRIHHKHPEVRFRLDANQSWPAEKIGDYSGHFYHLPVEYIEEPAKFENRAELDYILKQSQLPVALDESIEGMEALKALLQTYPGLFFVIKPALFGNFLTLAETLSAFRSTFNNIVITTALESSIGRSMVAAAAFLIGDKSLAHGLNTGQFLADDVTHGHSLRNGKILHAEIFGQSFTFNDNRPFLKPLSRSE